MASSLSRTGPCRHRGGTAQVTAVGCHGNGVLAPRRDAVERALFGLPAEDSLIYDGGGGGCPPEEHGEAVPLSERPTPPDAQRGFASLAYEQLLHGPRRCREEGVGSTTLVPTHFGSSDFK